MKAFQPTLYRFADGTAGIHVRPDDGNSWQKGDAFKVICMANTKSLMTAGWREGLVERYNGQKGHRRISLGSWSHLGEWLRNEKNFLVRGREAVIALKHT